MVYHGIPWYTMMSHGIPWYTMVWNTMYNTMVYHGIPWYTVVYRTYTLVHHADTMVHHGIPWYTMVYHGIPRYTMVYHGIPCIMPNTMRFHRICYGIPWNSSEYHGIPNCHEHHSIHASQVPWRPEADFLRVLGDGAPQYSGGLGGRAPQKNRNLVLHWVVMIEPTPQA